MLPSSLLRALSAVVILGAPLVGGCPGSEAVTVAASPCQVAPPTTLSAAQGATVSANLDAAYTAFKGSAGASVNAKSKVDAAFAAVSDGNAVCEMVLRTVTCALTRGDNTVALGFKDVIREKCAAAPAPNGSAPVPAAPPSGAPPH